VFCLKKFSRLIVYVITLTLILSNLIPVSTQAAVKTVHYVALGDSLAAGRTPYGTYDKGFSGIIAETLNKQSVLASYSNAFAVSGYTTQQVLADLTGSKVDKNGNKLQDVIKAANLITVTAGANDLIDEATIDVANKTVTLEPQKALEVAKKVGTNITGILLAIKKINPTAQVYVSGYYNAFPYLSADQQVYIKQVVTLLNGFIEQSAITNGAIFVPLEGIFDQNAAIYLPNQLDIHPSIEGYELIAERFLESFIPAPKFKDVPESYWAYKEISLLAGAKVLTGISATQFAPEKALTRAEAAQALYALLPLDKSLPPNPGFKDVSEKHPSYMAIAKLTQKGIFSKASSFNPNDPLTRAQMAKILTLAFHLKQATASSFKDVRVNYWAKPYINALLVAKITLGYPDKTFKPENNTTRAQFAAFLIRASEQRQ
jgi:lysophospholipase L1-like esterase